MKHRLLGGLINGPTPPPCFLARLARSAALGNLLGSIGLPAHRMRLAWAMPGGSTNLSGQTSSTRGSPSLISEAVRGITDIAGCRT